MHAVIELGSTPGLLWLVRNDALAGIIRDRVSADTWSLPFSPLVCGAFYGGWVAVLPAVRSARNFSFNCSIEKGLPIAGAVLNSSSSAGPP